MAQTTVNSEIRNHGCEFPWCEALGNSCEAQQLEHIYSADHIPATARSLSLIPSRDAEGIYWPAVGFGIHYNEDLDPAPVIFLHLAGGWQDLDVDADLRIDEAVMLHALLGKMIDLAAADSAVVPDRVLRFYKAGEHS